MSQHATCPICRSPAQGPFRTRCGHIYCYECITTHLAKQSNCPLCFAFVTVDSLSPSPPQPPPRPLPQPRPSAAPNTAQPLTPLPTTPPMRTPVLTADRTTRRDAPPPLPRDPHPRVRDSPTAQAHRFERAEACAAALDVASSSSSRPTLSAPGSTSRDPLQDLRRSPTVRPRPAEKPATSTPPVLDPSAVPLLSAPSHALLSAGDHLSASQLAVVIASLSQKLQQKEGSERRAENHLLLHFLQHTRAEKQTIIDALRSELGFLDRDISTAKRQAAALAPDTSSATSAPHREGQTDPSARLHTIESSPRNPQQDLDADRDPALARKRALLSRNYDALQSHYFETVARQTGDDRKRALRTFTDDIYKLTQYSRFRDRATLIHVARVPDAPCNDVFKASNIVSSIEFDRDSEFLATAGVTRRIKIFEFANITRNLADVHYPVREIPTAAKLSWVCWNPYIRHHLVSSDYEGIVTLWDVNRGSVLQEYEEHENRAWSVDYCPAKPTYFASGSDDGRVKLWTTSQPGSVLTIDNKPANVCSVKFHPTAAEKLAFGSVDYNVHYYDLRNTKQALHVFKSHSRAVSYVKFMSDTELVSASVDSTVKLWDLNKMELGRTFTGHMNDKNFVGLSVTPDYIACGSEENTVFCYYKAIPRPFTGYRFSSVDPLTGEEINDDDDSQFVSSVCWCPTNSSMVVAANSLGAMKVLQLDTGDGDRSEEGDADRRKGKS